MRTVALGEVATLDRATVGAAEIVNGTKYVGLEHIAADGSVHDALAVSAGEIKSNKFAFRPEHVLFGKLRPNLGKVADPDFDGVCSTDIIPVRPGPTLDRRYLFHYLRTPRVRGEATRLAVGINLPRLKPQALAELPIPLPPVEEQRRIAAVLDAADDLRTKRRQALAKLDTLTQAIFIDMFGGNWDRWGFHEVESLAVDRKGAIRTGPFGSQLLHEEFVDEGIAVLGIDNAVQNEFAWGQRRYITEAKYEELKRFTVHPGDVLVTIMGTCGRVAIVPESIPTAINTKHLCCISLDQDLCLPEWLWASLLFHPRVLDQLGATFGAVMPGLNMGKIKQAEIPLAPLDVQAEFVQAKASVTTQRQNIANSLTDLDTLFASLQQRAFAGEL